MLKPKIHEIRKPTKTISGVTPVAVVLPPRKCKHGTCIYCPSLNVPQSYTPKSPAIMRAMLLNYDSFKQVKSRIEAFKAMNHPTDKIELIIMGGTFLQYSTKFQGDFIKGCYDALNEKVSKDLEQAKKLNEKTKHRCVALCIETRPDVCTDSDIKRILGFGATRVELGVQIIDDKIYRKIKRGHTVQDVIDATKRLKDAGFKVGYHIMPGLPGSNLKNDLRLFKKLFEDENFKPDQLKIYPCQVIKGAELEKLYWRNKYNSYTKEQLEKLLIQMLKVIPRYCRVMRVMRELPPDYIIAGTTRIDLRKDIEEKLREKKIKLKEIRYREIGFALRHSSLSTHPPLNTGINKNLKLKITKYKSSKGDEYFLEIVNNDDVLFGLLRLRILGSLCSRLNASKLASPSFSDKEKDNVKNNLKNNDNKISQKFIRLNKSLAKHHDECLMRSNKFRVGVNERGKFNQAIIRELHVYGQALKIGQKGKLGQHIGLGKWLMQEAEKIARKENCKEIFVISGVGVREYYRKLGYKLDGEGVYVVKGV